MKFFTKLTFIFELNLKNIIILDGFFIAAESLTTYFTTRSLIITNIN